MTTIFADALPFYAQYPPSVAARAASGGQAASATPADATDIRNGAASGQFTATAGDSFSLSGLYAGSAPSGASIAAFRVALRSDRDAPNGGMLTLDGNDVSDRTSFSADEFARLAFVAGPSGSTQDLVVVAQGGTLNTDGSVSGAVDSAAVQLTAKISGTLSLNAMGALLTQPPASDAGFVGVAQESAIFTGTGANRPALSTVGNLTAASGDILSMSRLFTASAPAGSAVAGYRVALRDDGSTSGGRLMLDGADVGTRTSFSADEFARLDYVAGNAGSAQDLVVVAQTGTRAADGTLTDVVDSPAMQLTADATGTRSLNAAGALLTAPVGDDANVVRVAQEAGIFAGTGQNRPTLSNVGNLTAASGDTLSMSSLFTATAPSGGAIAGYRVALRDQGTAGGAKLLLGGVDVSARTSFSADEFARLDYVAGSAGSAQDLAVVAQTGTANADGTLSNVVDSQAMQLTASATGTRSINAIGALLTQSVGADASFVDVARQASIFGGADRPSLTTVGNVTGQAGDMLSLASLYTAAAPSGGSIAGYRVALRDQGTPGGAKLLLDGADVSARTDFSADEFAKLDYVLGAAGSAQDLAVVAQTGTLQSDGTLSNVVDSQAVELTATASGARSLDMVGALLTQAIGSDSGYFQVAQQASILTGTGQNRPSLSTVGNFSAAAGDKLSLGSLYSATAPAGGAVAGYRVALRGGSQAGGGSLTLDGVDVGDRTSFTPAEFSRLAYQTGGTGSSQDLVVVAQAGSVGADGTLTGVVDSPAVQISASIDGSRSVNAIGALLTQGVGSDAAYVRVAQEASIFTGFGNNRPSLGSIGVAADPSLDAEALAALPGAYQTGGSAAQGGTSLDLSSLYAGAVGHHESLTAPRTADANALATSLWAQGGVGLGGYESAGGTAALQRIAIAAYRAGGSLS